MSVRICVCCGEPMAEGKNQLSRNPNICASCSSLADGMDDSQLAALEEPEAVESAPISESPKPSRRALVEP